MRRGIGVIASLVSVPTMSLFFALLAIVAEVTVVVAVVLWAGGKRSARLAEVGRRAQEAVAPSAAWLAWIVALACVLGSLYLSEVAHFVPCKLCWYQRIAMYPLVVLLLVAAIRDDRAIARATLPLVAIGAGISVFHYLVERFPAMAGASTCDPTAPCTVLWILRFHYLSIPAMALSGFLLIGLLVLSLPSKEI
ncbi:MAG TPA: disulfide oxidoreductase [Actinomycetota bacterium]|nr:disulfide oxidoreductase [Actinomycetota bacterium]